MPDVRSVLERADHAVSNVPLPPGGLERLHHRRDRRRRNQRLAAGVVGIAVFVAAVWIVTTGGPFDDAGAPIVPGEERTTGPTGTPPHPAGIGLMGLPPEGATPSAPVRGDLVLAFTFGHTGGDPGRFGLSVYADGRVIWQRLGDSEQGTSSTGLIEQRLTPEGVDLVLAEVLETGLFDRDRDLGLPPGLHYGGVEVHDGDRNVHLTWGDAGFEQGSDPIQTSSTPEQVGALERLDARLEDLASWVPASAWEDRGFRAYVPSKYQVCYNGEPEAPEQLTRPQLLDALPAPASNLLGPLDVTGGEFRGAFGPVPYWCSVVTTDEARSLEEILQDAPGELSTWSQHGPSYGYTRPDRSASIGISFDAVLPDGVKT